MPRSTRVKSPRAVKKRGATQKKTTQNQIVTCASAGSLEMPSEFVPSEIDSGIGSVEEVDLESGTSGTAHAVASEPVEERYVTASGRRLNPQYTREDLYRLLPPEYFLEDSQHDPNCRCICCLTEWDLEDDCVTEYQRVCQQIEQQAASSASSVQ